MLSLQGIKLRIDEPREALLSDICKRLRISEALIEEWSISKEAIDARKKSALCRVFNIDIKVPESKEDLVLNKAKKAGITAKRVIRTPFVLPAISREMKHRPLVCGFGPCGIFAGYILAQAGLRPIILERGASMEERVQAVNSFWETGRLNETTNVQFGEGGAGTFSDAKLTTGTGNPVNQYILSEFVSAGAPEDILYKSKPHVGTDIIRKVVVNLRKRIEALGGEVRFQSAMTELSCPDGLLRGISVNNDYFLNADVVILALGHSARDSVRMLYHQDIGMAQKPFSMGLRIEHLQADINRSQYGGAAERLGLPPAEYKLSFRTESGRGVYTFCMCPGGYVVASASLNGELVVNGMSYRSRDSHNANSAVLVDVYPSDYASEHPLSGLEFQETYERLAFNAGGKSFYAPVQRLGEFLGTIHNDDCKEKQIIPTYRPGVTWTKLDACLPPFVAAALREALPRLGEKLPGFDHKDAVLTGIESRSSSPVRILRNARGEAMTSLGEPIVGLYAGGEGAGYAGGIMSAAADGIYLAQAALQRRE